MPASAMFRSSSNIFDFSENPCGISVQICPSCRCPENVRVLSIFPGRNKSTPSPGSNVWDATVCGINLLSKTLQTAVTNCPLTSLNTFVPHGTPPSKFLNKAPIELSVVIKGAQIRLAPGLIVTLNVTGAVCPACAGANVAGSPTVEGVPILDNAAAARGCNVDPGIAPTGVCISKPVKDGPR